MADWTENVLAVIGIVGGILSITLITFNLAKMAGGPASAPPERRPVPTYDQLYAHWSDYYQRQGVRS